MATARSEIGPVRAAIASLGAGFIFLLIRIFGRTVRGARVPWLAGPHGRDYIGDRPYEEHAERAGLSVTRRAERGGLVPDMSALDSDVFETERLHPEIRRFYEQTAVYRMDLWSQTHFPASIGLWLLVTTISRSVDQLNFPLRMLDVAKGMDSEIVLLCDEEGRVRYTGWYRRLVETGRAIYTGFYTTQVVPHTGRPCVKVVFPMPQGNATVILEPRVNERGDLELRSGGRAFGDAGFYRINRVGPDRLRVWRIRTLHEHFRVYVDDTGTLRCDHAVRFLGMPVLHLHYRIERESPS